MCSPLDRLELAAALTPAARATALRRDRGVRVRWPLLAGSASWRGRQEADTRRADLAGQGQLSAKTGNSRCRPQADALQSPYRRSQRPAGLFKRPKPARLACHQGPDPRSRRAPTQWHRRSRDHRALVGLDQSTMRQRRHQPARRDRPSTRQACSWPQGADHFAAAPDWLPQAPRRRTVGRCVIACVPIDLPL